MVLGDCFFETDRLVVGNWSRLLTGDTAEELRDAFVVSLLTEPVTRDLPPPWQGQYNANRASQWFSERQGEGTVLLIAEQSTGQPVGLLILSEDANSDPLSDIRLGYLLHEFVWDHGLATEVVAGLADWCITNGTIRSLIGGVAEGNDASARVLLKNGFAPHIGDSHDPPSEVEYILNFTT